MEPMILTLLQLVAGLLPTIGVDSTAVNRILAALIQIVPIATSAGGAVINSVKAIITALQTNADLTDAQLATLAVLSDELDAQYESTVAAYLASKGVIAAGAATSNAGDGSIPSITEDKIVANTVGQQVTARQGS